MQRTTVELRAHVLLASSLILFVAALWNIVQVIYTFDYAGLVAAVMRAGRRTRQAVYMTRLRLRAARIALHRGIQTAQANVVLVKHKTVRTVQGAQQQLALATDTSRIINDFSRQLNAYRNDLIADVIRRSK